MGSWSLGTRPRPIDFSREALVGATEKRQGEVRGYICSGLVLTLERTFFRISKDTLPELSITSRA